MKRALRGLMWVMLSTALVVMVPRAFAQRPPQTEPPRALVVQKTALSWDRSTMPGELQLIAPKTILAYDRLDYTKAYGHIFLTCSSSSYPLLGRCPTEDTADTASGHSIIGLQLREQRSGLITQINVYGELLRADGRLACSSDYWKALSRPLHTSYAAICSFDPPAGTSMHIWIPGGELGRLVAGSWTGAIELDLRSPIDDGLGGYRFDFEFTITDRDAVAIYFPHFDEISPHVGLNLRYDPITQTVGGGTTVDMCLYDGLGSQAPYLGVTVRDSGGRTPGPSGFSAWHRDSGGSDDSARLDYDVTLDYNGAPLRMRNGLEEQLTGIDTAKLKLVVLPGMSQPVFCVDTPLRLNMPRVPIAEKQPGYYRGDLKVELRVPTGVP